ncbi:MAG: N-acetylmuramoyl-L-alanine amidase, partial [Pseudomonadota bacterium]
MENFIKNKIVLAIIIALFMAAAGSAPAADWRVEAAPGTGKVTLVFDEAALVYLTPSFADGFISDMFVALAWDTEVKGISVGVEMDGKVVPVDDLWMPPAPVMDSIRRQGEENTYLWSISPPPPRHLPSGGSLQGKRIFISPGHGLMWTGSGWYTQRGEYQGIIEDDSNARLMFHFMIPMLERMGATVLSCRERGNTRGQVVVDNDPGSDGSYEETGEGWAAGAGDGYGGSYRICPAAPGGGSAAHFYFTMPTGNVFPVYMRWVADSVHNPATQVRVVRPDAQFDVTVNQMAEDRRWYYIGSWFFAADTEYEIVVTNNGETGSFVAADAIRVGGGMGEIYPSGASPSGNPKWREAAKYWIQYVGAPSDVYNYWHPDEGDSDVVSRPLYADWEGGDAYFSHHTNGFNGSARGTISFIHDSSPSPGSAEWQEAIHSSLIHTIKTIYDPDWYDRGTGTGNYGELRLVDTMPAVLMETAFHDNEEDAGFLKTPSFRHDVTRAMAAGMGRYFSPELPGPPLPPIGVR